jgi:hypothetical protein
MANVEDIMLFYGNNGTKKDNDKNNQIRESIIANINNIDDKYYSDEKYGEFWTMFREKLIDALSSFCADKQFHTFEIKQKGGMKYNYDFQVSYFEFLKGCPLEKNAHLIKDVKIEFKNNNSSVNNLAQFLEIFDKDFVDVYNISSKSYAEYYYDNYLDKYIALNHTSSIEKPLKPDYLKYVRDIKYTHPFFSELHSNKTINTKLKRELANQSMKKYLEENSSSFNYEKITEKIQSSQRDKYYLLWDCEKFNIKVLEVDKIKITGIINSSPDNAYIDVNVDNFEYNIRVRLNWGNNLGLCNPRWKFTFINK